MYYESLCNTINFLQNDKILMYCAFLIQSVGTQQWKYYMLHRGLKVRLFLESSFQVHYSLLHLSYVPYSPVTCSFSTYLSNLSYLYNLTSPLQALHRFDVVSESYSMNVGSDLRNRKTKIKVGVIGQIRF